jgi:hypothetical protein
MPALQARAVGRSRAATTRAASPRCRGSQGCRAWRITERAAQAIVNDLEEAGYITRTRIGRLNHYSVDPIRPFSPSRRRRPAHRGLANGASWPFPPAKPRSVACRRGRRSAATATAAAPCPGVIDPAAAPPVPVLVDDRAGCNGVLRRYGHRLSACGLGGAERGYGCSCECQAGDRYSHSP